MSVLHSIPETLLQKAVWKCLSEPSRVWQTVQGIRIQVLSPGRISLFGGPDFQSFAILANGDILIGSAEYHRKSSDWILHKHADNKEFNSTILHIVSENDKDIDEIPYTIIVHEDEIKKNLAGNSDASIDNSAESLMEIQYFALLRLMRKSAEAKKNIEKLGTISGIKECVHFFLESFEKKRRRPLYTNEQIRNIGEDFIHSGIVCELLTANSNPDIIEKFSEFINNRFSVEGDHLRREIFLNCLYPLCISFLSQEKRSEAFSWFWSVHALHPYGILKRQFPTIPQEFLWQQQGMLEYRRMHGERGNISSEALQIYGFDKVFSFFRDATETIVDDIPLRNADYDIAEDLIEIE